MSRKFFVRKDGVMDENVDVRMKGDQGGDRQI